jgi:hypothetical protein
MGSTAFRRRTGTVAAISACLVAAVSATAVTGTRQALATKTLAIRESPCQALARKMLVIKDLNSQELTS